MSFRIGSLATLTLAVLMGATALAVDVAESKTHDGNFVSVTDGKLVMTNAQGKEHTHTLAADAKMTLDGKACKASDLKAGTRIRVTLQTEDPKDAVNIEAIDKNPEFAIS